MPSALQMLLLNDSSNMFLLGASFRSIFKSMQKCAFESKEARVKPAPEHFSSAVIPTTWWSFSWHWLREL